jgi:hypothetical protein
MADMSDDKQNPFRSPQLDEGVEATADKGHISPAKRGFWLGFKTTAWVMGVIFTAGLAYMVYDGMTGKEPVPYLVPTILGFLCLSFSVVLMLSLFIGAGAAMWMAIFSLPLTRKRATGPPKAAPHDSRP